VVYLFDNCVEGANQPIETLGVDLGNFLNGIKYDDGTQVPQIDLVAHSMGGLIARAYLSGLQTNGTYLPPYYTLVRKLVLIATPNFGSFAAGNYAAGLQAGTRGRRTRTRQRISLEPGHLEPARRRSGGRQRHRHCRQCRRLCHALVQRFHLQCQ
jgi:pimeloyl-ACP methyl ester carboxylesterase